MTIPYHGRPDLLATAGHTDNRPPAIAHDARFAAQHFAAQHFAAEHFAAEHAVTEFDAAGGMPVREWWPVWLGTSIARRYAELLAGVRAAQALAETAVLVGREQAERARGDGVTWEQIGEALGLEQGPDTASGYDLGIAAFEYFTGEPGPGYPASFQFCCASCGEYITDHGPFDSHPEGNEQGHAEGCVRLAADLTAWRVQQEAWQAEGWPAEGWPAEGWPAAPATPSMVRGTGTRYTARRGGGRASWSPGLRAQPWLAGHGQHARRTRRRPRGRLVR
jgi:hypothetical protein